MIKNTLLPVKVVDIIVDEQGLRVELEISAALHHLKYDNPDFDKLLETLQDARTSNVFVLVTETDNHEIIEVKNI